MALTELWKFLKHPYYQTDENSNLKYRFVFFLKLLGLSLVISLLLGTLIGSLETITNLDLGEHAMEELFNSYSASFIFVAAVVLAPLLEELLFRGPMIFFQRSRFFKFIFYLLTLSFGFYHLINFEVGTTVILLSPILVAPQIIVGAILGFIRVRFGLLWAILLHASYNLILIGPILLMKILEIPLE